MSLPRALVEGLLLLCLELHSRSHPRAFLACCALLRGSMDVWEAPEREKLRPAGTHLRLSSQTHSAEKMISKLSTYNTHLRFRKVVNSNSHGSQV